MNTELDYYTLLNDNESNISNNQPNTIFCYENFNSYKDNFDWKKYILMNEDLKDINSKKDAIHHWINYGINEKRKLYLLNNSNEEKEEDKHSNFDWEKYKSFYKDLKKIHSKKDALIHWENHGKKENRIYFTLKSLSSSSFKNEFELPSKKNTDINEVVYSDFDWETYVNNYEDLKKIDSKEKAWNHWLQNGKKEKRVLFNIHKKIEDDYLELKNNELLEGKEIILFEKNLIFKPLYDKYGLHYFGWKGVMSSFLEYIQKVSLLKTFLLKEKIFFDEWIEKLLIWGNKIKNNEVLKEIKDNHYKLITFIHNPPYEKYYSLDKQEKLELENKVLFHEDLLNKHLFQRIENQDNKLNNNLIYIYTLSISHKEWIHNHYPDYRKKLVSIHHPIHIKEEDVVFNFNKFKMSKKIYHIGWWLRNFKTFVDFSFPSNFSKNILVKKDFENQWLNININFNLKNINIVYELNNQEYEKIFQNCCVFLDLEDTVANNVILECIKFCTPILVKKNDSIIEYLGENYPLYFNSINDLKKMEALTSEEWLQKILYTHEYLLYCKKEHLLLDTFNKKICYDIEKLSQSPIKYKLTWIIIINKKEDIKEMEHIIEQFLNQILIEKLFLLFFIDNTLKDNISIPFPHPNISFKTFEKDNEFSSQLHQLILSLETSYITIPSSLKDIYKNNFSQIFIEYLDSTPTCDIGFSSFIYMFSSHEKIIHKIYEKDVFFFKKNILGLKKENIVFPLVYRKNIMNLLSFQNNGNEFLEKCFLKHLNINCVSEEELCTLFE